MHAAPISRRDFLQLTAILGTTLPWIGFSRRAQAQQADLVARRVFFDNPDYGNVRVSPDGRHLAYVAPVDGVNNLWVAELADPAAARPVTRVTDRNIGTYFRWAYTNRHLVFFRERDGDENWRASSVDITNGAVVPLTPEQGVKSFLQDVDYKFPEEMLIRHNARDKSRFDLFRVNVVTGASELKFENTEYADLFTVWKNRLGDPGTEAGRAFLAERSPINHLVRATKPILIAQGMRDVRVVAAESEQMVAALRQRNVPVTYITFADEGHGFVRPENRLAFNGVAEAFLAKHLGGRCQPIGNDFAGSSLRIETGGEWVPGIGR